MAKTPVQISHGGSQGFKSPHLHPTTGDQRHRWSSLVGGSFSRPSEPVRTPYWANGPYDRPRVKDGRKLVLLTFLWAG
jgi:hypothetical protein